VDRSRKDFGVFCMKPPHTACAKSSDAAQRAAGRSGTLQLESKDDLKVRGEASIDDRDTLAMTFAVKVPAKARPRYENLVYSFPDRSLSWMRLSWMQ
jgi:hypothetical protein